MPIKDTYNYIKDHTYSSNKWRIPTDRHQKQIVSICLECNKRVITPYNQVMSCKEHPGQ